MSASANAVLRSRTLWLWVLLVGVDTAQQLLMKHAGNGLADPQLSLEWLLAAAASPAVWIAVVLYVATFGLWMLILHGSSLSLAFPVTALTYVGVILGSHWLLGEAMSLQQYLGVGLIILGVTLLRRPAPARSVD